MNKAQALLAVFILLLATAAPTAVHGGDALTVLDSAARVNFPSGVNFSLDAASGAEITEVSLLLSTPSQRYGAYTRNVRPDFRPGTRITASYTWPRYGTNLPPGSEISYRWRLSDASGGVLETAPASLRVEDSRFRWRELRDGMLTLRWYNGSDGFGRDLLDAAVESVERLSRDQGVDLKTPVTLHIYASQPDLFGAMPGLPGWAGGVSLGEHDMVMATVAPGEAGAGRKMIVHELTHQMIYQITFYPALGSRVPAWLNEGLAVVAEGDTARRNQALVDDAAERGDLPTLRSLGTSFAGLPTDRAQLAYAASESAVRYLLDQYGAEQMRRLLASFGQGRTADDALQLVYGFGVDQTEDGWRRSLGLRPVERGAENAPPTAAAPAVPRERNAALIVATAAAMLLAGAAVAVFGIRLVRRGR